MEKVYTPSAVFRRERARPPLAAVSFSSRNPSAGRTVRVTVVPGSAAWQSVVTAPFTIAATVMG